MFQKFWKVKRAALFVGVCLWVFGFLGGRSQAESFVAESSSFVLETRLVRNVSLAYPQQGSTLVNVGYDLGVDAAQVSLEVTQDNGATWISRPLLSGSGFVSAGTSKMLSFDSVGLNYFKVRVRADALSGLGEGFKSIAGGSFTLGASVDAMEVAMADAGTVQVSVGTYRVSVNDVTWQQWAVVRSWAWQNGYGDLGYGDGRGWNHPVQSVSWYDAVKWANAASERAGLVPCYRLPGDVVYKMGQRDDLVISGTANGFRLPTEAEWERAARGGMVGQRFPTGGTLSQSAANYFASPGFTYDSTGSGGTTGLHPNFQGGTSPVGAFPANGLGIFDMAGNVYQWCWDWYQGTYVAGTDPQGAANGTERVMRGGNFYDSAEMARVARRHSLPPGEANAGVGFRIVRGATPGVFEDGEGLLGQAVTIQWDANSGVAGVQDGVGTWDGGQRFLNGGSAAASTPSSTVVFGAGTLVAGGTNFYEVALSGSLQVAGLRFETIDPAKPSMYYWLSGGPFGMNPSLVLNTGMVEVHASQAYLGVPLTGNAGLTKKGTGTLLLVGTNQAVGRPPVVNTYQGPTQIQQGTLWVTNSGNVPNNSTIEIASGANLTLAAFPGVWKTVGSSIFGLGSVTKKNAGTVELAGTNSFSGGITVDGGSLVLGPQSLPTSGTVQVKAGASLVFRGIGGALELPLLTVTDSGGTLRLMDMPGDVGSVTWKEEGVFGVSVAGGSGVELSIPLNEAVPNKFGALTFGTLGSMPSWVTLQGSTLRISPPALVAGVEKEVVSLSLRATSSGNVQRYEGFVEVEVMRPFPVTGARAVAEGDTLSLTVQVPADAPADLGVQWFRGGTLVQSGSGVAARTLTRVGARGSTEAGTYYALVQQGWSRVRSEDAVVTFSDQPTLNLNLSAASGAMNSLDVGTLSELAGWARPLSLSGFSSMPPTVQWNGTTVSLAPVPLEPVPAPFVVSATVVESGGGRSRPVNVTMTVIEGGANGVRTLPLNVADLRLVDVVVGNNLRLAGPVQGQGGINKMGGGVLVLAGSNNYSGVTSVGGGSLILEGSNAVQGVWTVNAPGRVVVRSPQAIAGLNGNGEVILEGSLRLVGGQSVPFGGALFGPGALIKEGPGEWVLGGSNTYGGGTVVNAGTLRLMGPAALPNGPVTVAPGAVLLFDGLNGNITLPNTISGGGQVRAVNSAFVVSWNGGGTEEPAIPVSVLAVSGSVQTVDFSKLPELASFVAPLTVSGVPPLPDWARLEGVRLSVAPGLLDPVPAGLNFVGEVQDSSAQKLRRKVAVGVSVSAGVLRGVSSAPVNLSGPREVNVAAGDVLTLAGPVAGPGGLNKLGGGQLVLSGSNNFSGLSVRAGLAVLSGSNSSMLGVEVLGGASVRVASGQVLGGLSGGGGVEIQGSALTLAPAGEVRFDGVISGSGALVKDGPGGVTLGGANGYGGGTVVRQGVLRLVRGNALGAGSDLSLNGGTVELVGGVSQSLGQLSMSGGRIEGGVLVAGGYSLQSGQVGTALSGGGALIKSGGGVLVLSGSNSYSGGTVVQGGELRVLPNSLPSGSTVTLSADSRLVFDGVTRALNLNVTINGGQVVVAGTGGFAVVWNNGMAGGSLPSIVKPPVGGTVEFGQAVRLSVEATVAGGGSLNFQWKKNGVNVSGQTTPELIIDKAQPTDSGRYSVLVSNPALGAAGSRESLPVEVLVRAVPVIVVQPADALLSLGQSIQTLNVGVGGVPPESVTYQWFKNGVVIPGATRPVYVKDGFTADDAGQYSAKVNVNLAGVTTTLETRSADIRLGTPQVRMSPLSSTVLPGETVVFKAVSTHDAAAAAAGARYEWSFNGEVLSPTRVPNYTLSAKGDELILSNVQTGNTGSYDVRVSTEAFGFATARGLLRVAGVSIRRQPAPNVQLRKDDALSLSVEAEGVAGGSLSYQWRREGRPLTGIGVNAPSLLVPPPAEGASLAGVYDVVVTSTQGDKVLSVVSASSVVSVFVPVGIDARFGQQSRRLDPGQRLVLDSFAVGSGSLSYQWWKDGAPVAVNAGGTQPSFSVSRVSSGDAGVYRVRVTQAAQGDISGSVVESGTVTVSVSEPPKLPGLRVVVNQAPVVPGEGGSVGVNLNAEVVLSMPVEVSSGVLLSYQWRRNGVPLASGGRQSELRFAANSRDQEGRYDVVVTSTAGSTVSSSIQLQLAQAPVVLESALPDLTLVAGSSTSVRWSGFKASAGNTVLRYRWSFNGNELADAKEGTYEFKGVSLNQAGTYTVTAENGNSSVSSTARLRVLSPVGVPTISGRRVANPGERLVYQAALVGADSDTRYQWVLDGQPVAGANASQYSLGADALADGGTHVFSVRVFKQDSSGKVLTAERSEGFPVRVRVPVSLESLEPAREQWLSENGEVKFEAKAAGDPEGLVYKWLRDGVTVSSGTQSVFVAKQAGVYSVEVSNVVNSAVSAGVPVRMIVPVKIVQQPTSRTLNTGKPVLLSVSAQGSGTLSYQWRKDGQEISGATGAEYRFEMKPDSQGQYDVVVSADLNGRRDAVTSLPAEIRLNDEVSINLFEADAAQVLEGRSIRLRVNVKGVAGSPLRFQWRRNGVAIAGGVILGTVESDGTVSSQWLINGAKSSDGGDYDVQVSSGAVSVSSAVLRVEVFGSLAVSVSPTGNTSVLPDGVTGKGTVRLSAQATAVGGGSLQYRWFRKGFESETLSQLAQWDAPVTDELARYQVEVKSVVAGLAPRVAVSEGVEYQLLAAPAFTQHPGSVQVEAGQSVSLKAAVRGGGKLSLQWERRRSGQWTAITGAVSETLVLGNVKSSDEGNYRVVAKNERGSLNSEMATVLVNEEEVISRQPASVTVNPEDTAIFSVEASGVDLSYQWRKDGVALSSETGSTLKVGASSGRVGLYDVVVSHAFGKSVSSPARLSENQAARIELQPVDTSLLTGAPARLFVVASGTPSLSYQWQKNERDIPAATQAVYAISSASVTHAGTYRVLVSNVAGKVWSSSVQVSVVEPLEILEAPVSVLDAQPGDPVTFSVKAKGSGLKYAWRKNGVALVDGRNGVSGSATAVLRIESVDPGSETDAGSAGRYDVVVSNAANTIVSVPALLTVSAPPVILQQPRSQVVNRGDGARFSVRARGTGLSYQWYMDDVEMAGATGANLVLERLTKFGMSFYCVVKNASGSVKSSVVTVSQFKGLRFASFASAFGAGESGLNVVAGKPAQGVVGGGSIRISAPTLDTTEFTLKYQWRKDGRELSGETGSLLVLAPDPTAVPGVYDVVISAELDGAEKARIVSPASLVTVVGPPQVEVLADQTVKSGQSVLFAPVAVGSGTLRYRWSKRVGDGYVVQQSLSLEATANEPALRLAVDEVGGVLRIDGVRDGMAGVWRVEVTDDNGTTLREVALKVEPAIVVSLKVNGLVSSGGSLPLGARSKMVLEAVATGDGPFTYQWRFKGSNVAAATKSRFEVGSLVSAHEGRYDVVVSGASARVVSAVVDLKVQEALRIVAQPPSELAVNLGASMEIPVEVNNANQGEAYQWYAMPKAGGSPVPVGTGRVLQFAKVSESQEGSYRVVVTAAEGRARVTSSICRVVVKKPARITEEPRNDAVAPGAAVRFVVVATGDGPLSFVWRKNGVAIPGARALETNLAQGQGVQSELTLAGVSTVDAGSYDVVVTNPVSPSGVTSRAAVLSVSEPVRIVSEPLDNLALKAGPQSNPVILSVEAQGTGSLSYQWRFNGKALPGQTQRTLSYGTLTAFQSGLYDVVVRDSVSRTQSRQAKVEVAGDAQITGEVLSGTYATRVYEGATAVFRAFSAADQTVVWKRNGGDLDSSRARGVTSPVMSLRNVTLADSGSGNVSHVYSATVSGGSQAYVLNWRLEVVGLPVITAQPVPLVGALKRLVGGTAEFGPGLKVSSDVETDRDTQYQWYFQRDAQSPWYAVAGATSPKLRIEKVQVRDVGNYRLEISNPVGTVSTDPAALEVFLPVSVNLAAFEGELSGGKVVAEQTGAKWVSGGTLTGARALVAARGVGGGSLTLKAVTTGDLQGGGVDAFDWYVLKNNKWTVLPDAREGLLSLQGLSAGQEGYYRVRALGVYGGVVSEPIRVALKEAVAVVEPVQRRDLVVGEGDVVTLSAKVTGTQPQYRWLKNGAPLTGFTDSGASLVSSGTVLNYVIQKAALADSGTYSVEVRNEISGPLQREVAGVSVRQAAGFRNPAASMPKAEGLAQTDAAGMVRIDEGQILELSVEPAEGCAPFTYQWRFNGVALPAAKGLFETAPSKLLFNGGSPVTESNAGQYDVVISNRWGKATSSPVRVLVALKPRIVVQPSAKTASEGGASNFAVQARGEGPLSYRWFKRDQPAQTLGMDRLLTLSDLSASAAGQYRVEVSNRLGKVESADASLTVTKPGDFTVVVSGALDGTAAASPLSTVPGKSLELRAAVTPAGAYTYQWRKDGVVVAGAVGPTLPLGVLGSQSGGGYEVAVSDGANFAYAAYTVSVEPRIESFEVPSEANLGDGLLLQVKASSSQPLSYEWRKNGVVIAPLSSSASADAWTVRAAKDSDFGVYQVRVVSSAGEVLTEAKRISRAGKVSITTQPVAKTVEQGGVLTLSVVAQNALTYQWYRTLLNGTREAVDDGSGISGANSKMLSIASVSAADGGIYEVEVSGTGGSATSVPVTVTVLPKLSVSLTQPSVTALGSPVNLVASVVGSGTISYKWSFTPAKPSGSLPRSLADTGDRMRLSSVGATDSGTYSVEVTNGSSTASASAALTVLSVPKIIVAPATQSARAGASVTFAVAASYEKELKYTWYFGSGESRVKLVSGTRAQAGTLKKSNLSQSDAGTYTVVVEDAANPQASVEVSARLTVAASGDSTGGQARPIPLFSNWWVYRASGVSLDGEGSDRYGFYAVERLQAKDSTGSLADSTGRTVWLWAPKSGVGSGVPVVWGVNDRVSLEAADNNRSEFSVVASRPSTGSGGVESYVLSGRVEDGSSASLYGAPELMAGEYDVEGEWLELDLSWENASAGVYNTLDELKAGLLLELEEVVSAVGD